MPSTQTAVKKREQSLQVGRGWLCCVHSFDLNEMLDLTQCRSSITGVERKYV